MGVSVFEFPVTHLFYLLLNNHVYYLLVHSFYFSTEKSPSEFHNCVFLYTNSRFAIFVSILIFFFRKMLLFLLFYLSINTQAFDRYTPETYPDSSLQPSLCGQPRPSFLCDPNDFLSRENNTGRGNPYCLVQTRVYIDLRAFYALVSTISTLIWQ